MVQLNETASWKKFFVFVAGRTNDAHEAIVEEFQDCGHVQVSTPGDCDYRLVFCPVASRVGTDIEEALEQCPGDKPIILVVMHHTFDPNHYTGESRRQVQNPNVRLTVDCLFHARKFLECNRNDIAWFDIQRFLGFPQKPEFGGKKLRTPRVVLVGVCAVVLVIITLIIIFVKKQ